MECNHEWRVDNNRFVEGCIGAICIKCGYKSCGCKVYEQNNGKIPEIFWQIEDIPTIERRII